jgi:hypothetical protein
MLGFTAFRPAYEGSLRLASARIARQNGVSSVRSVSNAVSQVLTQPDLFNFSSGWVIDQKKAGEKPALFSQSSPT